MIELTILIVAGVAVGAALVLLAERFRRGEAYRLGWKAGYEGRDIGECPYWMIDRCYDHWNQGWADGAKRRAMKSCKYE